MKRLTNWVTWLVAGFYSSAFALALVVAILFLLSQAEITTDFELAMWQGTLGLSLIPVLVGLAILIISLSGTLVSGTRFVNRGLEAGEKSHNPMWGVFMWFVPLYGFYKAFVMGKSIERAVTSEANTTSKLFLGFFLSWMLGVVSEASSRTNLEPQTLFQASMLILTLIMATWFYMSVQAHNFLKELRTFSSVLQTIGGASLDRDVVGLPITRTENTLEKRAINFCTNCGQKRIMGTRFCGECGSSFE